MATANQLLNVLTRHIGKGNGIGVKALATQLGTTERHVRTLTSELREDGHAVCGTPQDSIRSLTEVRRVSAWVKAILRRSGGKKSFSSS